MIAETSAPLLHGPHPTSRMGIVLALDLTAPQTNLVTERGSQLPRASLVVTTAARRIIELSKAGDKVECIAVLGTGGEPLEHPDIKEVTENLRALRDKWFSRAKLCLFSSAKDLSSYPVRASLSMYNRLFLDFEWGTTKVFTALTGQKSTVLASLCKQLTSFEHVTLQTRFVRGDVDNSTANEIKAWLKRVEEIGPHEIHVLNEVPQTSKKLKTVTKSRLTQIVDEIAEKSGVPVHVHEAESLIG